MMNNAYDEMEMAIQQAEEVKRAAKTHARRMARFLVGNLRDCNHSELVAFKKELKDYNIHTGKWKKS